MLTKICTSFHRSLKYFTRPEVFDGDNSWRYLYRLPELEIPTIGLMRIHAGILSIKTLASCSLDQIIIITPERFFSWLSRFLVRLLGKVCKSLSFMKPRPCIFRIKL